MSLRGELYRLGASIGAAGWRARLSEIESHERGEIEQRSLSHLLEHSITNVPYYRELGIPDARLDAYPLLSRGTLRSQFGRLSGNVLRARGVRRSSTGGSTGEPVWVLHDREFSDWDYATNMFYMNAFYDVPYQDYLRSRRVAIWHRRRRQMVAWSLKRLAAQMIGQVIYIEPYEILSHSKLAEHVKRINQHAPDVILAFAGTVFEIAKYAQRMGIPMQCPRFILSSGEMLYPPMRDMIEDVFGCPVYNRYGAAEVGRVAAECKSGKLHVFSFNNHVEVIDEDGTNTPPGEIGRIVITTLHNAAMPLIRYDIGDLARVSSETCDCGSSLPCWDEIAGRVVHHFVRSDGSLVRGGNFVDMFYEYEWVMQCHVLQEDVDRIRISYARTPGEPVPAADIDTLNRAIQGALGEPCNVVWEEVPLASQSTASRQPLVRSLVWEKRAEIQDHESSRI